MRRMILTPAARRDYRAILDYLLIHSEAAAEQLTADLNERVRLLAGQPRTGRPRDDLAPGVRTTVVGRYVVLYRFTDELVEVLRIIHGSRDVERVFREPE